VFASVFKNRSFSRASEELHLTQPTISNHIKSLEEEFNCKLFDRLGRTIIPTKEAEVLYNHSTDLIERAGNLKEAIGQVNKEITGKLTIGASTIPGVYLLPRLMSGFRQLHPSISFQILIEDSKGIIERISRHELLLGIVGAKLGDEPVKYTPFVEDELIVVSPQHFSKSRLLTLQEVLELPMVLREEGSGTRKETEKFLAGKGFSLENVPVAGIFGSTDAIKQAVKAGLGISILSKSAVAEELQHKTLEEIKLTDMQMKRRFYIVSHKKRTLPLLYETFLKHLLTEAKNY
jgi:DNA-binding transcriptional LysR family regulator